ncbi:GCG_CRPN prefix-to-repeats domain-containing protein [uncultured Enterovirga sp.]|uniref:GCG_CRPN prefix-to-repeats domain-containing protein n=1 Tax=uncultured Enterovirga sp. TaxID=2026352 RepID=UPI0035CBFD90
MSRAAYLGIGAGMLMFLSTFGAQAMPVAGPIGADVAPLVEQVADGCGRGFRRGRAGFCRPFGGGGYGYGGPRFYGPPRFNGGPRFYGPRRGYYGGGYGRGYRW